MHSTWVKERVTAWEPHKAITMELYESQWPLVFMRWQTVIAADNTGTRVTQKLEYQVKFGLWGRLLDKLLMRRKLDQTLSGVFVNLKQFVENGEFGRTMNDICKTSALA